MSTLFRDSWDGPHGDGQPNTPGDDATSEFGDRPDRDALAYQLERARIEENLFGIPAEPIKIGRFTLLEHVGKGGMGDVYAAYDPHLDRKVAIKLVRAGAAAHVRSGQRLLREAYTLARLSHPNVVQVHDSGEHEGWVFLAMEYIHGQTLASWLIAHAKREGRICHEVVLDMFVAIGRGLLAAHRARLVHRDFKPQNVLIGDDGRPRVVDFGLACLVSSQVEDDISELSAASKFHDQSKPLRAAMALTTQGQILGTPEYMAPEQMRGEPADERSDQFSFCVALYEALCGHRPFAGENLAELKAAVEAGLQGNPSALAQLSSPLRAALVRGLASDPERRFSDMGQLLDALVEWPRQQQARRQRWRRVAALVAFAVLCGGGAGLYGLYGDEEPGICAAATRKIDILWQPEQKKLLADAFRATGVPVANAAWSAVESQVDAYVDDWRSTAIASCEATHVERTQSTAMLDARSACLERSRRVLAGVLDGFSDASDDVVISAAETAQKLPDLAACSHPEILQNLASPPPVAVRKNVAAIEAEVDRITSLRLLGDRESALEQALKLEAAADKTGYARIRAEVLFQVGMGLIARDNAKDAQRGIAKLAQARRLAVEAGQDHLVATIWTELIVVAYYYDANTQRGRTWYEEASAVIRRIGDPPYLRFSVERHLALLDHRDGKFQASAQRQRKALEYLRHAHGDAYKQLRHALLLQDLASSLRDSYQLDEADTHYQKARTLLDKLVGAHHPLVVEVDFDRALLYLYRGRLEEAQATMESVLDRHSAIYRSRPMAGRMIAKAHVEFANILWQRGLLARALKQVQVGLHIYRDIYPSHHRAFDHAYQILGAIQYRRGEYAEALAAYQRALSTVMAHEKASHADIGYAWANIAEAMVALKRWPEALEALVAVNKTDLAGNVAQDSGLAGFLLAVSGRAYLGLGQQDRAIHDLEGAVRKFDDLGGTHMAMERAGVYWALARALGAARQHQRAVASARKALNMYQRQSAEVATPSAEIRRWLKKQ